MKISEQWLREWVSTRWDTRVLMERMTMAGVEAGGATPVSVRASGVVVGQVQSVAPVAGSERLVLCAVRLTKNREIKVVSGASNIAAGMKVAVALPGAKLADGASVSKTEIRGVVSDGMICSGAELGIEDHSVGVLELEQSAKAGASLKLAHADTVLEFDITPNRGDCLSAHGLAREIAAISGARVKAPRFRQVPMQSRRCVSVKLAAQAECPRYVGRAIEDINPRAVTPLWLRERLYRSGVRSIHPVVDVLNYVMLDLGQPMHAFDLDKLRGNIVVRRSHKGESISLLDGKRLAIGAETLLIADDSGAVALAGIMGGLHSAVTADTKNVFLESAWFAPDTIAGAARRLGLQTESSQRFERGVDTSLQRRALEQASALLRGIVGGRYGPITERTTLKVRRGAVNILLRSERVERMLGLKISDREIETILKRLGMGVRRAASGWKITPPSYRFDIAREIDLIEEVIRIRGYDGVPERNAALPPPNRYQSETAVPESRIRQLLIDRDYQEVITYSFVAPELQKLFDPDGDAPKLSNPISADLSVMRASLWPGLVESVRYNLNRQQERLRLFEIGRCFRGRGSGTQGEKMVAGIVCGPALPAQWGVKRREVDFYDLKADVETLAALTRRVLRFAPKPHPALQPGSSAQIELGSDPIGWLGILDPGIRSQLDISVPVLVFEVRSSAVSSGETIKYREISRFPSIRRDIAVVLPLETGAETVCDKIRKVAGKLLVNLELFDEYRGEGIDSGRKSLALGLTLQDSSRTLKEAEADQVVAQVLEALERDLGGRQRR